MPKLYMFAGMVFFFYSDDHLPMHLHVTYQGAEMKAELHFRPDGSVQVTWKKVKKGMPNALIGKAELLIEAKADDIREKWQAYHILGKHIKPERILRLR